MVKVLLLALLAFTAPIQAQVLYACTMHDGMADDHATVDGCCDDHRSSHTHRSSGCDGDVAPQVGCMEPALADDANPPASAKSPVERTRSRDSPSVATLASIDSLRTPWRSPARAAVPAPLPHGRGTDTYRLTLRLRL